MMVDSMIISRSGDLEVAILQLFEQKDWLEVIEKSNQFHQLFPELHHSYLWLGHAYKELADYKKAKKFFHILANKFPREIFGLEGLVLVALEEKNWFSQIKYATLFQESFPDLYHSYLWLGHANKEIGEYKLAEKWFHIMEQKFPNQIFGLEGLYLVAEHQKDWKQCFERACQFQAKFPDNFLSYRWIYQYYDNMGQYDNADKQARLIRSKFSDVNRGSFGLYTEYARKNNIKDAITISKPIFLQHSYIKHIDYVISLLNHNLYIKAEQHIIEWENSNINDKKFYYYLLQAKALAYQSSRKFKEAYNLFQEALSFKNFMGNYRVNVVLSAGLTYKTLKLQDDYTLLINELMKDFPFREDVWLAWADLSVWGKSFYEGYLVKIKRLKKALAKLPYSVRLHRIYIDTLLSVDEYDLAESHLNKLLKRRPSDFSLLQRYAKLHHHKKDWQQAYVLYNDLCKQYPNKYNGYFYYFANTLVSLDKIDELKYHTHEYNKQRYSNLLPRKDLDDFQVDMVMGNYHHNTKPQEFPISMDFAHKNTLISDYFSVRLIINNKDSEIAIICFEGSLFGALNSYAFNEINTIDVLDEFIKRKDDYHHYLGFAKNTKQFNFLLVSDYMTNYYQANQEGILDEIKAQLKKLNAKYIVCFGESSGGFASILFAEKLGAHLVFSFMPRCQAFAYSIPSEYQRAIQLATRAFNPERLDIGYIQHKQGGLSQKTYLTFCENEPSDAISVKSLNHNDPNLHITYCCGDKHAMLEYLGAKNIYREMTSLIEKEYGAEFKLPIQKDFLKNVPGYKCSSADKLPLSSRS